MEILKEIAEASTFQVECFDGKLLIEGSRNRADRSRFFSFGSGGFDLQ
jgi:hypothetical protein